MIFWRVMKVSFDVLLEYARCFSGPNSLLFSSGLRKHIKVLEREKATLKQQAEELQRKLEATEEHRATVEEKLTEGSVTAIEHMVGVIKNCQPDFEPNLILQGYIVVVRRTMFSSYLMESAP